MHDAKMATSRRPDRNLNIRDAVDVQSRPLQER